MSSKFESMTGRTDYPFVEYDLPPSDPFATARQWYQDALEADVREPRAMVLATVNRAGIMSSRVMATLDFVCTGVVFATHSCSRKIQDINEVPIACGHFYWKELGRQLSVSGQVESLSRNEAINVWDRRPIPLHAMSAASYQSQLLDSYHQLLAEAQALEDAGALPCPESFTVYRLTPTTVEFWASSSNRLHRRLRYEQHNRKWRTMRLQP